nr:hypothetical protein CFP56_60359 [Quercus suber]
MTIQPLPMILQPLARDLASEATNNSKTSSVQVRDAQASKGILEKFIKRTSCTKSNYKENLKYIKIVQMCRIKCWSQILYPMMLKALLVLWLI